MKRVSLIASYLLSTAWMKLKPRVVIERNGIVNIKGRIKCEKGSLLFCHDRVGIRKGSYIYARKGSQIEIGNSTTFNHNCMIVSRQKITVGRHSIFGPGVIIYDHDHDYKGDMRKYTCENVVIGDNCWIGANVVILKGVVLGNNCVVAAGTVLRRGIYPDNSLIFNDRGTEVRPIWGR